MPPSDPEPIDLREWSFDLPPDRIARQPLERRDGSRLLVVPRDGGPLQDRMFGDLREILAPGDRLVANDTRVMPARLAARRATGGAVEILALDPGPGPIRAMVRPARKLRAGDALTLADGTVARVVDDPVDGIATIALPGEPLDVLERLGSMPLPPYMERTAEESDRSRYQTVFAREPGSAAAPTAGLHFTPELLADLRDRGVDLSTVTLRVGIGTFRPLRDEDVVAGRLHRERWAVTDAAAAEIAATRAAGGRIVAIGTTAARTLESATPSGARVPVAGSGETDLFVRPGYEVRAFDASRHGIGPGHPRRHERPLDIDHTLAAQTHCCRSTETDLLHSETTPSRDQRGEGL